MPNSRHTFSRTTLKVRLVALCFALIASGSVLGSVLMLFDAAGDASKVAQAIATPTKSAVALAALHAPVKR